MFLTHGVLRVCIGKSGVFERSSKNNMVGTSGVDKDINLLESSKIKRLKSVRGSVEGSK